MGNQETTTLMMKSACYTDITFTRVDEKIMIGATPEECIAFALAIGPAGEVFRKQARNSRKVKTSDIEREMRIYFNTLERDKQGVAPTYPGSSRHATRNQHTLKFQAD